MKTLNPILISGKEVLPLIEGGKGIAVSDGRSSGAWAAAGAVGTISGVFADMLDDEGVLIPRIHRKKTRKERHHELIEWSIQGGINQARLAHEISNGRGRIHMNVLWEMAGSISVLEGIMDSCEKIVQKFKGKVPNRLQPKIDVLSDTVQKTLGTLRFKYQEKIHDAVPVVDNILGEVKNFIHGITCGAGMPYRLAEIASKHQIYYYPIVSSARAFRALWLRAYKNCPDFLGGVVYEDPWLAGGHNGLSNSENPDVPERPYERLVMLRRQMNEYGFQKTPIIMAGGVWNLSDFEDYIDNPDIGLLAFQLGTRPLITRESPVLKTWYDTLICLQKGEVVLQNFSPTGFYSSAVRNRFLQKLIDRKETEMPYLTKKENIFVKAFQVSKAHTVFLTAHDFNRAQAYIAHGLTIPLRTPDLSLIFVSSEQERSIKKERANCAGCLSQCLFSGWSQADGCTGRLPDPRSFCIRTTLEAVAHEKDVENHLMFAGHNAYRFALDPLYKNGFVPTVAELIETLKKGL